MGNVPMLPDELKGVVWEKDKYRKSAPRKWTKQEEAWIKKLQKDGYKLNEIAESVGRTPTSVSLKLKRISKKTEKYNDKHRDRKYKVNEQFLELIKPKSVLDAYCGTGKFYNGRVKNVITNDIDNTIEADYNLEAFKLLCLMNYEGKKFDVVDLDAFGSAYDSFDLSMKIAKKGLIITFGEYGHKRWKRLDFLRRTYGIESLEDITVDNMIAEVQRIAAKNKKVAKVEFIGNYKHIFRVWFSLEELILTEQWDKK
jgi:tRNA G26 N,N-dimethylase Trm1